MRDGEGERGSARHPPAGAQVGQLNPQHLYDHLIVQGQVEVMLVGELGRESKDLVPNHV